MIIIMKLNFLETQNNNLIFLNFDDFKSLQIEETKEKIRSKYRTILV